jgi:AraC family transcriptional regulator, transcriptional activator of pobA
MKRTGKATPVYCLDSFSQKAKANAFYIEALRSHLRDHPFVSKPHRHDFYLILYVTKGAGEHTIDFVTYPIRPHSFFLMTPGQVHSWNLDPDTDGFILFFIPEFYRMGQSEKQLLEFPFFHSLNPHAQIRLKQNTEPVIDVIVKEMLHEYEGSEHPDLHLLRSYLDIVLLKLARHYTAAKEKNLSQGATFKLRKLEELIDQHFGKLKQPRDYAELMNLSAAYLNNLCKQNLDKTLSELIQQRVGLEAKRLFAYSDLTVNQVSDKLNFKDPSYFVRFFKKQTGTTPEQFKVQLKSTI